MSDETLVAGMASGDAQAAASFVRRYQARVYGLALSIVGVPATAEDVAQEALVRAWRFSGGYDPRRGAVLPWLLAIARNAAIDAVRMRRDEPHQPEVLLALLGTAERATGSVAEWQQDSVAEAELIRSALLALPREQAVAVVLATFYGLTAKEIAEREVVPLGTAKTRIRLGLARLRERFEVRDE
ncbi:sigma-70 family RNA polymerase sigma factor [Actinomycetes bacterium KLBMP 9797]